MSSPNTADLQRWFARLVELDAAGADAELVALTRTEPLLAAQLRELLKADAELAGSPTEPLLPVLRGLRDDAWEGRTLGAWHAEQRIGSGGMGTVYRAARTIAPEDVVALKVLRADRDDAALRRRFVLERKVLQSLQHPGIARLVDSGESADGVLYVAMELVEGMHILDYADRARLDLAERAALLGKVCAAVAHAHARQVVHRDIKNSNILVTAQGQPKLLDFGIAKPLQAQFGTAYLERTATAQRFFSAASAAPEQLRGGATGPACDVYALGVLLYELLCGETPFALQGATPAQIERAITQHVPVPPSRRIAELPSGIANARARQRGCADRNALAERLRGDFDRIVAKALRKDPAQRQPSVERFAHELRAACRGGGAPESRLQRVMQRVGIWQRIAVGTAAALIVGAITLQPRPDAAPGTQPAPTPAAAVSAGSAPARESAPADPAAQVELLLVRARVELQRRAPESALELLREAEALLPGAGEPRELALRLAAVRANAATSSGDFPLAAQALDTADALAATAAERSSLTVQRARLLSARGRDAEASSLLRSVAADTLPQLHEDDPLTAQIRAQLAGLDSTARASAVPHDAPGDATSLAARLDAFSRNLERARAEAGIDAPALAVDAASQQAVRTATAPASAPAASDGTPAQLLATDISRACELNAYGRYREAAQLLDVALDRQRSDPALRHGDDYRLGALAAAVARHGTAPTPDSALRLSHELARDVWLTTDASRARWREQTAIARRLGVERAE